MNKQQYNPWLLRLWHSLNALLITGLLLTVILTATFSKITVKAKLIRAMLVEDHLSLSYQQSLAIGRALNAKYWTLHLGLGYGLAATLAFRIILEIFMPAPQQLFYQLFTAYRLRAKHSFCVKLIYASFYLALLLTVVTGLLLSLRDRYPVLQQYALIHQLHESAIWFFLLFIIVHLAGVTLNIPKVSVSAKRVAD